MRGAKKNAPCHPNICSHHRFGCGLFWITAAGGGAFCSMEEWDGDEEEEEEEHEEEEQTRQVKKPQVARVRRGSRKERQARHRKQAGTRMEGSDKKTKTKRRGKEGELDCPRWQKDNRGKGGDAEGFHCKKKRKKKQRCKRKRRSSSSSDVSSSSCSRSRTSISSSSSTAEARNPPRLQRRMRRQMARWGALEKRVDDLLRSVGKDVAEGKEKDQQKEKQRKKDQENQQAHEKQEEGKEQELPRKQCWRCCTCGDRCDDPHCKKDDWGQRTPLWLEVQLHRFWVHKQMHKHTQKEKDKEKEDRRVQEDGLPGAAASWQPVRGLDGVAEDLLWDAMPPGSSGPTRQAVYELSQELGLQQLEELSRVRRLVVRLQRQLEQEHQKRGQHQQEQRDLRQRVHMHQQELQHRQHLLVLPKPRPPRPPLLPDPLLLARHQEETKDKDKKVMQEKDMEDKKDIPKDR